jgi:parvulin-like peptidyl-prolyl isomerase
MEDKTKFTISVSIIIGIAVVLLLHALYKQMSIGKTVTAVTAVTAVTEANADTYYENGRNFSVVTRLEGGCNYVVVRSIDGVAVTQALNQPETCKR